MARQIKKLDEAGLQKLQALELKFGCCIVAMEQRPRPAVLSEVQLAELKALEKEMNLILVAYTC